MASRAAELVRATRASLARAQVAWGAASWAAAAAPAAAALAFALGLLARLGAGPRFAAWAVLVLAAAAVGAARAYRRRVDAARAALWLDRSLASGELFSSALECLGRGRGGRFDEEVIARADRLAEGLGRPRPDPAPLVLRSGIALAACLASAILLGSAGAWASPRAAASARRPGATAARAGMPAFGGGATSSPREAARLVFPDDPGLAALAERALKEGRLDELGDLVAKADAELARRHAGSGSRDQRSRLEAERERLKAAARAAADAARQGSGASERGGAGPGRPEGPSEEEGGEAGEDGGSGELAPPAPPGKDGGESPEGEEGGPARKGGRAGEPDGGDKDASGSSRPGDVRPGVGAGRSRGWGRVEASAGGPEALVADDPRASLFNYVMPGSDPAASMTARVEAAARSAESAAARERLPWEYGDFLKSYFMALSKAAAEADRAAGAEGAGR